MRFALLLLLASAAFGQGTVISTNTWTNPSQTNSITSMSNIGYQGSVYDPSTKLNCSWGSSAAVFSEWQNALLCYSVAANRLFPISASHASPTSHTGQAGHQNGGVAYVPGKGLIGYVGDGSGSLTSSSALFGHLWTFDTGGMTGRDISTLARPWVYGTPAGSWTYSNSADKLIMYPGATTATKTVEYTASTNSYSFQSDGGIGLIGNFNLYENTDTPGVIHMFTGSATYTYTISTHTWAAVTTSCVGADCVSGLHPPNRFGQFMAYSPVDHLAVMGGGTSAALSGTVYSDTWTYNPSTFVWTELTAGGSYPNNLNTNWNTLTYDIDSNLFVLMPRANGGTTISLFALSTPLGYGRTPVTPTVTSGQLNRGSSGTTWALETAIAANGTDIYLAHQESCVSCANSIFPHTYVTSTPNTGAYTNLPTGAQTSVYASIDSEGTATNTYTGKIRLAYINGALWESNEKFGGGNNLTAIAKSWNGSAWSGGFIGCFVTACTGGSNYSQQIWGIIGVGTVPHVVTTEYDASNAQSKIVVAKYTGSWAQVGSTLNVGGTSIATGSRALSAAITTDGSNPSVCWSEEVIDGTNRYLGASVSSQIYCKTWTGAAWGTQWTGAGLNIGASTTTSWGSDPDVVYTGGIYYVAWAERSTTGANKIYVGKWNGTTFTAMGSALNIDSTTGWATRPRLATDGTTLYVSWEEQQSFGQHNLAYVKKWTISGGASWSQVGSAIAADTTNGSVDGVNMAMVSSSPTVIFSELNSASVRSIYAKQWNGAAWADLGAPPPSLGGTTLSGNVSLGGKTAR